MNVTTIVAEAEKQAGVWKKATFIGFALALILGLFGP